MRNPKSMKVPKEFDDMMTQLRKNMEEQTGFTVSKTAVMRKIAKSKLISKNGEVTWRIW